MSDSPERTLPLDAWHRSRGARMVSFAGYSMPIQYEGIIAEHRWTRESAGLFDVSHMGQLIVAGPEAEKGLESVLPADLGILKDGRLRYSLLLNDEGGIVDDLMATRRGDHFYVVVNGATKQGDIAYLRGAAAARGRSRPYEGAGPARPPGAQGGRRPRPARARSRAARLHDRRRLHPRRRPPPGSAARAIPARTASRSRSPPGARRRSRSSSPPRRK